MGPIHNEMDIHEIPKMIFAYFVEEHLFFSIHSYECSLQNLSRIYATPPFNNRLCLPIFYLNWFRNPVKSKEFYLCILFYCLVLLITL